MLTGIVASLESGSPGGGSLLVKREVSSLPSILPPPKAIHGDFATALANGVYEKVMRPFLQLATRYIVYKIVTICHIVPHYKSDISKSCISKNESKQREREDSHVLGILVPSATIASG